MEESFKKVKSNLLQEHQVYKSSELRRRRVVSYRPPASAKYSIWMLEMSVSFLSTTQHPTTRGGGGYKPLV